MTTLRGKEVGMNMTIPLARPLGTRVVFGA
jgi:hypothetical protein